MAGTEYTDLQKGAEITVLSRKGEYVPLHDVLAYMENSVMFSSIWQIARFGDTAEPFV